MRSNFLIFFKHPSFYFSISILLSLPSPHLNLRFLNLRQELFDTVLIVGFLLVVLILFGGESLLLNVMYYILRV